MYDRQCMMHCRFMHLWLADGSWMAVAGALGVVDTFNALLDLHSAPPGWGNATVVEISSGSYSFLSTL